MSSGCDIMETFEDLFNMRRDRNGAPVTKNGWLWKRDGEKSYDRRWFVLKGNLLFDFLAPEDREPLGVVILTGCSENGPPEHSPLGFQVKFHGQDSSAYRLRAESRKSLEEWLHAVTQVTSTVDESPSLIPERSAHAQHEDAAKNGVSHTSSTVPGLLAANASTDEAGEQTVHKGKANRENSMLSRENSAGSSGSSRRTSIFSRLYSGRTSFDTARTELPPHLKYSFQEMHRHFRAIAFSRAVTDADLKALYVKGGSSLHEKVGNPFSGNSINSEPNRIAPTR